MKTSTMFTGLSAFPLTPLTDDGIDEPAFVRLVERVAAAGVDSVCVLGSTGSYAYLDRTERARAVELAVAGAGSVPVLAGVGALRTREVLRHVEDAQDRGASAILLAPMSYQPLTDDEVFGLYEDVTANLSVPLVVYDNPTTTRVVFGDELHARIAELPGVASIKIPPVPADPAEAAQRVASLRSRLPGHVTLGVSGDGAAAAGLLAGCHAWYSVMAGILPGQCLAITRAATAGDAELARSLSREMEPLWQLMVRYGSYRVASAVAEDLGLVSAGNLPAPVRGLDGNGRAAVARALAEMKILG
ncbi:dihydrodipicolinate synthase family protein [Paeniglutamicibacter psychrophenolicus]|uniref:dihydrodipicolinate synthase family protein n=1 Tax=Paeniglutamicibacter psychrophenolicus TaxID=257454 RepID=UPI00278B542F|nr:dihydrodipicolinate synthase family protein [Paeniglutamicibacter psychrophenolicus]MDQ0092160.1 4-hydroxy-tetrahydrodipicolinate synthase [Paeniglutamicibacter psychrophenolicus]